MTTITRCAICLALFLSLPAVSFARPKEPKTIITGDQMEILHGGKMVIFSGNSKVTRGESVLRADRLIQDKKNDQIEAVGGIDFKTITKDREPLYGRAERGRYNPEQGTGELSEGRPEIFYHLKDSTAPVRVEADAIRFDQKKEEIDARGGVEIFSSSACAYAPYALFKQSERKIILAGVPPQPQLEYLVEGKRSKYRADTITIFMDRKTVLLEGNVHGTMEIKELDTKK